MRHAQEGTKVKHVLTHVDSDWAGSTDRCSTSSGVELHGRRPLDVGIMFGPHLVDRAQLHGTQERNRIGCGLERNMRKCRIVTTEELRVATGCQYLEKCAINPGTFLEQTTQQHMKL